MKRTPWLLLVLVAVAAALLLLDPGEWFQPAPPPVQGAEEALDAAPPAPAPLAEAAEPGAAGSAAAAPAEDRVALDASPGLTVIELHEADGRPAPKTELAILQGGELLHEASTDERGRVELEPPGGKLEVYAAPPGRPYVFTTVAGAAGRNRIALPEASVVAGRVLDPPADLGGPLRLSLSSDHPLHPEWRLPEAARQVLAPGRFVRAELRAELGEDGAFRFAGLPEDWTGELTVLGRNLAGASHGEITTGGWRLRLPGPVVGLELELAHRPELRGTVVDSAGSPVAGLALTAIAEEAHEPRARPIELRTDPQGGFRLPLIVGAPQELARFELRADPDPAAPPLYTAEGAEIPADGELGELRIAGRGELRFRVLDPRGQPVEGCLVSAGGVAAEATGPEGTGALRPLLDSAAQLRAVAAGYVPAVDEVLRPAHGTQEIHLRPANRLEVRVPGLEAELRRNLLLRLSGEGGVLAPASETKADLDDHTGLAQDWETVFTSDGEIRSLVVWLDGETTVFRALRPGVELRLELTGNFGRDVFQSLTIPALAPSETRRVDLQLGAGLRVFRARVRDVEDQFLVGARLQLHNQPLGRTGEDGSLLCLTSQTEPRTLVVSHPSAAKLYVQDFLAPAGGAVVDFQLHPASTVTVEVVDEEGARLTDCDVRYRFGGFTTSTMRLPDGRHEIAGLSPGTIEIEAVRKGRSVKVEHDSSNPTARIVFPTRSGGRVAVRLVSETGFPAAQRYSAVLSSKEPGITPLGHYVRKLEPRGFDFENVLPGEYVLMLSYFPSDEEQERGMAMRTVVEPVSLTVAEGETTELELDVSAEGPGG